MVYLSQIKKHIDQYLGTPFEEPFSYILVFGFCFITNFILYFSLTIFSTALLTLFILMMTTQLYILLLISNLLPLLLLELLLVFFFPILFLPIWIEFPGGVIATL